MQNLSHPSCILIQAEIFESLLYFTFSNTVSLFEYTSICCFLLALSISFGNSLSKSNEKQLQPDQIWTGDL